MLNHKRIKLGAVDAQGRNCLFYALRNDSEEQCFQIIRAIVSKDQSLVKEFTNPGQLHKPRRHQHPHQSHLKIIPPPGKPPAKQPSRSEFQMQADRYKNI